MSATLPVPLACLAACERGRVEIPVGSAYHGVAYTYETCAACDGTGIAQCRCGDDAVGLDGLNKPACEVCLEDEPICAPCAEVGR